MTRIGMENSCFMQKIFRITHLKAHFFSLALKARQKTTNNHNLLVQKSTIPKLLMWRACELQALFSLYKHIEYTNMIKD